MPTKSVIPTHDLPNDFFRINRIELADPILFVGHHRHEFYEFLWFTSDSDDHFIDFEPYPVRVNQVYFLAPGQVHAVPGRRPTGYALVFSPDFLSSLPEEYLRHLFTPFLNDGIALGAEAVPPLHSLLTLLDTEYTGQRHPLIIQSYLKAFLLHIYRASEAMPVVTNARDQRLNKLLSLIEANYQSERKAEFYAEQLGLTTQRVNELLKEKRGFTVTQAIHNQLVLEAKRRISGGEQSLKEIAYELGFNEPGYFSRFFRKQTGITPEAFRERIKPVRGTA